MNNQYKEGEIREYLKLYDKLPPFGGIVSGLFGLITLIDKGYQRFTNFLVNKLTSQIRIKSIGLPNNNQAGTSPK